MKSIQEIKNLYFNLHSENAERFEKLMSIQKEMKKSFENGDGETHRVLLSKYRDVKDVHTKCYNEMNEIRKSSGYIF